MYSAIMFTVIIIVAGTAGLPYYPGQVIDTPEVMAAKAQHFAAQAAARSGYVPPAGIPTVDGGVITHVLDTPEVMAAKAQHFSAYNDALYRTG